MDTEQPSATPGRVPTPLTQRVLDLFGAPRWLWIVLWSLVPLLSPLVFSSAVRASGGTFRAPEFLDFLATQGGLAFACLVLLWGTGQVGRSAAAARDDLAERADRELPQDLFRRMGSVGGPLILTIVVAGIVSASGWATYGPVAPLAALPFLLVYLVPILTFLWIYVTILADLHRLGRMPLALDLFPQDRTLGLDALGSLASTGLGLLLIAAVPVLLAGSDEPVTLGLSLGVVVLAVGAFILSMWRLHRQMAAAKAGYVATTRRLYADAYAPLRERPDLETLAAQSGLLGAAESLAERARTLPTWPLDEGAGRFVAVVVSGVVTSMVVRALFAAIGF
jgi:hypothetical protein